MKESEEKWNMFRNFMYNEIGITKNDIRTWIRETTQEEVRKLVHQTFGSFTMQEMISKEIRNEIRNHSGYGLKGQICEEIAKGIMDKIEIK